MKQLIITLLSTIPYSAAATSFDCTKAWHRIEKRICTNTHLSQLDKKLGYIYESITKSKELKQQQRIWILSRNQCITATNIDKCIESSYKTRFTQLNELPDLPSDTLSKHKISLPLKITTKHQLHTENWYPLPDKDMKAAAIDTALDTLSETGNFLLQDSSKYDSERTGIMSFHISLIGPAEIVKLTIRLTIPNQPSFISTSSISVHNLDYQGIYKAFEHIGNRSASYMTAKLNKFINTQNTNEPQKQEITENDIFLREQYQQAQRLKSEHNYTESALLFEIIATSNVSNKNNWKILAKDELKYGLLIYEAKQNIISIANNTSPNKRNNLNQNISRTKNILRQILAENTGDINRTAEAQKMIDDLEITQSAINTATQATIHNNKRSLEMFLKSLVMRKISISVMTNTHLGDNICDKNDLEQLRSFEFISTDHDNNIIVKDISNNKQYKVKCKEENITITDF